MATATSTVNKSIPNGETEYWVFDTRDSDALIAEVSSDDAPYTIDVLTSPISPGPGEFDPGDFVSVHPDGGETYTDTSEHESGTLSVGKAAAVGITNNSGSEIAVDGTIETRGEGAPDSPERFISRGSDTYPQFYRDGKGVVDIHRINNEVRVQSAADLPAPDVNGRRQLEDGTVYYFDGFTADPYTLELGDPTPLIAAHGSVGGFIHTGGGTALYSDGNPYFARDIYIHAPGGTIYDLTADQSTEMLVESVSHSDAAGLGNIASLGQVDGYRVITWKGVNFEHLNGGVALTGTSEKVFFEGCPLREVTESGVTVIYFDSSFEADIVDMSNNYVKSMQPDTDIIDVDPAATINDIFQYRGTTHDSTVTEANILTGQASIDAVGFRVTDSYPLSDSKSFIDYTIDSETATTIDTQAADKTDESAYERVAGATTERGSARFGHTDNLATYNGKRDRIANVTAALSLGTGTSDVVAVAWFSNGSLVPGTATRIQMNQQGGGVSKSVTATGIDGEMDTGDEFDVRVANLGSTADITVGELNAKITT